MVSENPGFLPEPTELDRNGGLAGKNMREGRSDNGRG